MTRDRDRQDDDGQRIDKWLWAARFFKTRSLAAEAVSGGKVQAEGGRIKPSRRIRPGTALQIRRGPVRWEVVVRGICEQRRPAREASTLYEETPESIARRHEEAERRKLEASERRRRLGRPTRRERREGIRIKGRED